MKLVNLKKMFGSSVTKEESGVIEQLVKSSAPVTINKDHVVKEYFMMDTLFNEIGVVPAEIALAEAQDDIYSLLDVKVRSQNMSEDYFLDGFVERFKKSLQRHWDMSPDCWHLIFLSSGNDSKVLISLLLELAKEDNRFLDKTLFVMMTPEHWYAYNILDHLGIDESKRVFFDRNYYKYLQFANSAGLNGTSLLPCNCPYNAVEYVKQTKKLTDKNPQFISSIFFNEIFHKSFHATSIGEWICKFYYSRFTQFFSALQCNLTMPILDVDVLKWLLAANIDLTQELRYRIIGRINSDLGNLSRMTDQETQQLRSFPPFISEKMKAEYERSVYYQMNKRTFGKLPAAIVCDEFYGEWSKAAMVERLGDMVSA